MRSLMVFIFMAGSMFVFISGITFEEGLSQDSDWAIALHGGAGEISKKMADSTRLNYENALELALQIGEEILENGGTSLDAVEQVVRFLEDHPSFNAGKGSVFTSKGTHELDASIMDGSTRGAGALTGLTTVKNPISLARKVMSESRHIFFSGEGAEQFADEMEVERVRNDWFSTPRRYEQWQRSKESNSLHLKPGEEEVSDAEFGTVGAVALDKYGNLASGTSTGGMTNKRFGRVGDVPIIGSGTYANDLVAISATGWGEQIMKHVSAHTIAAYLEFHDSSLEEAVDFVLEERLRPGEAGFIAVDHRGFVSMKMNTSGMFRAGANEAGFREIAIW